MFKELLHNCLLKGLRFSTTSSRKPTFGVRIFILTYERFTKKRPCSQFSLSPNTIETNCGQIMNEKAPKPKRSRAIGNTFFPHFLTKRSKYPAYQRQSAIYHFQGAS